MDMKDLDKSIATEAKLTPEERKRRNEETDRKQDNHENNLSKGKVQIMKKLEKEPSENKCLLFPANGVNMEFWKAYPKTIHEFDKRVFKGIFYQTSTRIQNEKDYLPTLPGGYYWELDMGGTITNYFLRYRLWGNAGKFSYGFPLSE